MSYLSLDIIFGETQRRLTSQVDQGKQLEGKANILTGFAGLAATTLPSLKNHPTLLILAGLSAFATFALGAYVLHPKNYATGLRPGHLRDEMLLQDPEDTKLSMIDCSLEAIDENQVLLGRKSLALELELYAFMGFVALVILGRLLG